MRLTGSATHRPRGIGSALALLCAIGFAPSPAFAQDMKVAFDWGPTKQCFDPRSPPITLSGVPAGTAKLAMRMADQNSPYNHGGGEIAYKGQAALPYGAFRYKGPCPPAGRTHFYKITVTALDAAGKPLASASGLQPFPKK